MKDKYMIVAREGSDEVWFYFTENFTAFNYIANSDDDSMANERMGEVGDEFELHFMQTLCRESFMEGYNVKDVYCYQIL